MPYFIYTLSDPRDLITRYVGISLDPIRRYRQHMNEQGGGSIAKESWLQGLLHLSIPPHISIIDEAPTEDEARSLETFWIDYYRRRGAPVLNTRQRYASPELVTTCYQQISIQPEEAENAITEIARCIAQGRFQDISIKQIAQIEWFISIYTDNYAFGMALHGFQSQKAMWQVNRANRRTRLGIVTE
jgi:hypothetical protein